MPNKTIYASVLLVDNKIKFWKVSSNAKREVGDFYKDFYYSGEKMKDFIDKDNVRVEVKEFIETENNNAEIFQVLAPQWFSQWKMIDNYKGSSPFDKSDNKDYFVNIPTFKFNNDDVFTQIVPCNTQFDIQNESTTLIGFRESTISMCQIEFLMNSHINLGDNFRIFGCKNQDVNFMADKEQSTSNVVSNMKIICKKHCKMYGARFDT